MKNPRPSSAPTLLRFTPSHTTLSNREIKARTHQTHFIIKCHHVKCSALSSLWWPKPGLTPTSPKAGRPFP